MKSVSLLRKRIEEFFDRVDHSSSAEDLPTPSQLAIYLGYSSAQAMYRDINNPEVEPEYAQILDRAVDILKDNLQRRQLRMAEARNDWQGVDAVLQRMDKAQERTEPVKDESKEINVNISIEKKQRIQGFLDDRLGKLMADAEFEDVKTPLIEEIPQ